MKTIAPNSAKKFHTQMTKFIKEEMNGTLISEAFNTSEFIVNTDLGRMRVSVGQEQNVVYSMFCKFEEPKRAVAEISNVNQYSGKYNFHMSPVKIDTVIEVAKIHLELTQQKKEKVKNYLAKLN